MATAVLPRGSYERVGPYKTIWKWRMKKYFGEKCLIRESQLANSEQWTMLYTLFDHSLPGLFVLSAEQRKTGKDKNKKNELSRYKTGNKNMFHVPL